MPYRRLPNTDNARYKALKTAFDLGKTISPVNLAFSQATYFKVKSFTPNYEMVLNTYKETYSNQVKRNKEFNELQKKAKLYISHFIQVMNFGIARGELPASSRVFYGIDENETKVPNLNSETDIISWGEKLIKGDAERVAKGGNYITNPTMGNVKVRYDKFLDFYWKQKSLQETCTNSVNRVTALREEADKIILSVWNEVEEHFKNICDEDERREKCAEYGVVYVWRPTELKRAEIKKQQTKLVFEDEVLVNSNLAETRFNVFHQASNKEQKEVNDFAFSKLNN